MNFAYSTPAGKYQLVRSLETPRALARGSLGLELKSLKKHSYSLQL
jgi:hypothetical protein